MSSRKAAPSPAAVALTPLVTLARRHTEAAVGVLAELLDAPDARIRLAAVEALLDRGWGKVSTQSPTAGTTNPFDLLSYEDLLIFKEALDIVSRRAPERPRDATLPPS